MLTITKEHIALAKRLGACSVKYREGQRIDEVRAADLAWIAERAPVEAAKMSAQLCEAIGIKARAALPLSLFGYGDGYGYAGYGYGYGSAGDGSGSGAQLSI